MKAAVAHGVGPACVACLQGREAYHLTRQPLQVAQLKLGEVLPGVAACSLSPIKLLSQTEQAQDRCQLPSPPSWPSPTRPTWDLRATVHVSGSISLPFPSCPTAHFSQTRPILWPGPPLTLQGPQGQHQNSRGSQGLCSTWTAHLVWKDQVRHLLPLLGAKLEPSSLYSALGRGLLLGGAVPSTAPPAPPTRTCSPLSGGLLRPGSGLLYTLVLSWGW